MSVKESVLQALNDNKENGEYLSGEKLSETLGVSRAAVWKAIKTLREEGYLIDAVTRRGYRLQEKRQPLCAEEIRRCLPAKYRNNDLFVYDIIDSTNNRARQIAVGAVEAVRSAVGMQDTDGMRDAAGVQVPSGSEPVPNRSKLHGTAVIALQQTAGKGRLGRSFFSPKEGVYLSIIVKPDFDITKSGLVTIAAAAAVAEAIDEVCGQTETTDKAHGRTEAADKVCGQTARIKWVNDVYLNGKKVCGILTEGITDFESGQIDHLIIGIGINTNLEGFPEELLQVAGAVEGDYSRSALAAGVISRVLDYLENLEERRFMKTYREKSFLIGRDIRVFKGVYRTDPTKELDGIPARVLGIDDDGGLQVIYTDGSRESLTTGEVTVRV